jgi:phytanoyl-CoA hydroxylase
MLDQQQINTFNETGFLVINDLFSAGEIALLQEAVEMPEVTRTVQDAGGEKKTVHMLNLTTKLPTFLDLARDTRITERLTPLMGADIQLQHSKLATQAKTRNTGGFGWHQDFAYFPHTNTNLIAVMVMLDDATPDNGCMHMLRGSHKLGLRDHSRDGFFVGSCSENSLWEEHPNDVVAVTPRAGGVSIHHCLTLHGSGVNVSGKPRRGLVFQYRADDAYQLADTVWADTGLMVHGKNQGLVRCDAGVLRLLPRYYVRNDPSPYGDVWHQNGAFAREHNTL